MSSRFEPPHIAFPDREAVVARSRQRCNEDNAAWTNQRLRMDTLIRAAAEQGVAEGERLGYVQGWHWGLVCGICAGALATGSLAVLWNLLQRWFAAGGLV